MILARHVRRYALIAVLVAVAAPPSVWAQSGTPIAAQDLESADALDRPARLTVRNVRLPYALTKLYERSGVPVSFSPSLLPRTTVSCDCDSLTVAAALERMLGESGLHYREIDGHVLVYRPSERDALPRLQSTQTHYASRTVPVLSRGLAATSLTALRLPSVGAVVGTVTERTTGTPIVNAQVAVDGRGYGWTDAQGRYAITNVPVGRRMIDVTYLSYRRAVQEVVVVGGATVRADFQMEISPSRLDALVVTVAGEQRVREMGHVVGQVSADSLVREAPISTLGELLTARVPGLQVFQAQGTVGGQVNLRIRGQNSLLLSNEPIVVVDGMRLTTGVADLPSYFDFFSGGKSERSSPLNDINANDIESIEVVKGPAAATLYGTDAANGVIVITTKRGRPGAPRWNAYSRTGWSSIPTGRLPDLYWGWGSTPTGDPYPWGSCTNVLRAQGVCAQDSVTVHVNPLKDPELSILQRSAPSWQQGLNVSGGGHDLRYYFSGDYSHSSGAVRMPPAYERQVLQERGLTKLPDDMKNPNTTRNVNLRANVSAQLGQRGDVQVNTGYVSGATRSLQSGGTATSTNSPYGAPFQGFRPDGSPYGAGNNRDPSEGFATKRTENTDRFFATISGRWRLASWLATRATAGHDLSTRHLFSLQPSSSSLPIGGVSDSRVRQASTTADLGVTVTARHGRLTSSTAVGAQYVRTVNDALNVNGWDLRPGGTSIGDAAQIGQPRQAYHETVTLGSYVEETVGLNQRLFLTAAIRVDGASTFGRGYDAAAYPKAGVSWLISEEPFFPDLPGLEELRFRYAYGVSGVLPPHAWSRPTFVVNPASVNGSPTNVIGVTALGNPLLRPERAREHEAGVDVAGFQGRAHLGLTWYNRRVTDQILFINLPPGLGVTPTNLGLATQTGFELELDLGLVDTDFLTWGVTASHAYGRSMLVDLGDARELVSRNGGYVEGYSLGARFSYPIIHYADADGDGFINPNDPAELVIDFSNPVYVGESNPPRQQTLSTTVGLLARRVRLSALFERRSGFTQVNATRDLMCWAGRCRESVDSNIPLAIQAEIAANSMSPMSVEPGDFTRLREVSASVDLPTGAARALGVRSGTMTMSGRNLALWTKFTGPDPESTALNPPGIAGNVSPELGIPQARTWTVRFDVGF